MTTFLRTVYAWMFVGLGVTAAVASMVAGSPAIMETVAARHILFVGGLIAELGLVFYLSARVQSLTGNAATMLFVLYSSLNGVTLSILFLACTGGSIATTFMAIAGMFGVVVGLALVLLSLVGARMVAGDVPAAAGVVVCNEGGFEAGKAGTVSAAMGDHAWARRARTGTTTTSAADSARTVIESSDLQIHGMEAEGPKNATHQAAYRSCMRRKGF